MDPTKHNYVKKFMKLVRKGKIPAGSLSVVDFYHDDRCGIFSGNYCNCDPDYTLRILPDSNGRESGHTPDGAGRAKSSLDEDTHPLQTPATPCPHCGGKEFIIWESLNDPKKQAISCNGCGAVMSSTHPLDPDDRPRRRF
jgi:hypothetical protein